MIVAGAVGCGGVGAVDGVQEADGLGDEAGMEGVGVDDSVMAGAASRSSGELPSGVPEGSWLT